mmetsp:Transcript_11253/g.39907  ORF Transcript_11253/g.39907 Transcript_11253/m.39907 type:complete len:222 (-) Transcript_11253:1147-1812(-)
MHEQDLCIYSGRSSNGHLHIPKRLGHRVPVRQHQTPLCIHKHPGTLRKSVRRGLGAEAAVRPKADRHERGAQAPHKRIPTLEAARSSQCRRHRRTGRWNCDVLGLPSLRGTIHRPASAPPQPEREPRPGHLCEAGLHGAVAAKVRQLVPGDLEVLPVWNVSERFDEGLRCRSVHLPDIGNERGSAAPQGVEDIADLGQVHARVQRQVGSPRCVVPDGMQCV